MRLFVVMLLGFLSYPLAVQAVEVASPDGRLVVSIELLDGVPYYQVTRDGNPVMGASRLGLVIDSAPSLDRDFTIESLQRKTVDETWTQPWGEQKDVRDWHNDLQIDLIRPDPPGRKLSLRFRVFNDGLGFRYEVPAQPDLDAFRIMDELTEFVLPADHTAWWIPAYQFNRYEYLYTQTTVSAIDTVHTPLTLKTANGLHFSIHEAALTDYASMTLTRKSNLTLEAHLVPWSDGVKVKIAAPMRSPWRTIQIADTAGGLIESMLILNLNEPNQLDDVSWIQPGKYVGIWWEMHLAMSTWHSGPRHGATTENARRYIDFAAQNNIAGVLVEGWNPGWDGDWVGNPTQMEYTTPHPDFDIEAVSAYAREKGVQLIGHHETGGGVINYENQLADAFDFYERLGVHIVKTGYVNFGQSIQRVDENGTVQREWHHGQHMVQHYRRVVEAAARHRIMLNVHEPIKPTGIRRTFPNMMTREGSRGQEFNAWSPDGGNPPEHTTILPFTRLLGGPMDFTPGIFDIWFETGRPFESPLKILARHILIYMAGHNPFGIDVTPSIVSFIQNHTRPSNRVNTTLAKQLALYVVIYSPLQMAADLPQNYQANPEPFQFIRDVATDWQHTRVLNGEIGDYVTIVRKDRHSNDWYLGSITDEDARELTIALDFLEPNMTYTADIYRDAPGANWQDNPLAIEIVKEAVQSSSSMTLRLAAGGGTAVRFRASQ